MAAPIPVPPPAAPLPAAPLCPCCARAAVAYKTTARLSMAIRVIFIRVSLHELILHRPQRSALLVFTPADQASYIETKRKRNRIQIVMNAARVTELSIDIGIETGV